MKALLLLTFSCIWLSCGNLADCRSDYIGVYEKVNNYVNPWSEDVEFTIYADGDCQIWMTPGLPSIYETVEMDVMGDSLYVKYVWSEYPCSSFFEATAGRKNDSIIINCHNYNCGNGSGPAQDRYYQVKGVKAQ